MRKVAIVGAGPGGIYTGWRLRKEKPDEFDVTIYESSERVGGRLLTWFPQDDHIVRGELGGMRFLPVHHKIVNRMVIDFYLRPRELKAGTHNWYLRNTRWEPNTYNWPPYNVKEPEEKGKQPAELLKLVIDAVAAENDNADFASWTRKNWDDDKPGLKWKGEPLSSWGFWNVMRDVISNEAYNFVTDAMGSYSLTSNWNAAEALQFISLDYLAGEKYQTLIEGYSAIATKTAEAFTNAGGQIKTQRQVIAVERERLPSLEWKLTFGDGDVEHVDIVVLGLPGRALELIHFDADVARTLDLLQRSVIRVPAFKLFLLYDTNWWPYQGARVVSDLALRQTCDFNPMPSERFMVMASYDDQAVVPFWQGLESDFPLQATQLPDTLHPHRFSGLLTGQKATTLPPGFHAAPPRMVQRAQDQLKLVFGKDLPLPVVSAYMDWSHDPFGGGMSLWAPGADVRSVMPRMRLLDEGLYVVGDSFSGIQGWVEGALTNAEKLLQDKFGLSPYVPDDYYLGY